MLKPCQIFELFYRKFYRSLIYVSLWTRSLHKKWIRTLKNYKYRCFFRSFWKENTLWWPFFNIRATVLPEDILYLTTVDYFPLDMNGARKILANLLIHSWIQRTNADLLKCLRMQIANGPPHEKSIRWAGRVLPLERFSAWSGATHSSACLPLYRLEWKLYIALVVRINKFSSEQRSSSQSLLLPRYSSKRV